MRRAALILALSSVLILLYMILFFPAAEMAKFFGKLHVKSPMYFLIVGHDRNIEGTMRADVILIAGIDFKSKRIVLMSIPRDLEWNGRRVNSYFNTGVGSLKKVVEEISEVKIDHYAIFDYESFKVLGDELGPVEITVKEPMNYVDEVQNLKINFLPGVHRLNGEQLLAYIRYRKGGMGDLDRIRRQREVFHILLSKALNMSFGKALDVYSKLMKNVETDVKESEMVAILLNLKGGVSTTFLQLPVVPVENGMVRLDKNKVEDVLKVLKSFSIQKEKRSYRIVLVNAKRNKTRYFKPIEEKRWLLMVGFKPDDVLWEDTGLVLNGSILLVCTKDHRAKEELYDIVEKVYPHRKFQVRWAAYLDGAKLYYEIVTKALKIRRFMKKPVDAVVVLGEVGG